MKLKEQLIGMGLTEEQAQKVIDEVVGGNYVPKSRFNEVNEENKTLKKSVSDRDKQFEDLKKSSGDNAALQQQISELQKQNADQQKAHDEELAKLKLDNAVEIALSGAKAKNGKAVKAMLDMSKVKIGEDGKLSGFDEQLEALKKSDGYMFDAQEQVQQQFTGFQPGASSAIPNSMAAGYEARLGDARKNNNQLEVIKIKQEAAAEGVVLM
ncbi:phage scaffolding protein [Lachnospiraceae bacterium 46-15]